MAGLRHPGRMIVREYYSTRIVVQRALDDLARIDARLRQRAAKHLLVRPHAVLRIQKQHEEHLMRQSLQHEAQIVAHCGGRIERIAGGDLFFKRAATTFLV